MSRTIQFGWLLAPGSNFPLTRTGGMSRAQFPQELESQLAEISAPFDSAWVMDHLQWEESDVIEGWTALSYLMGRFSHLHFGNMVLNQSFRNPALIAKMAATLQYLGRNRLYLGGGAGWNQAEYPAYGYPFPPAGVRVNQLDEAITIIRALWSGSPASFSGQHFRIQDAWCEPKPDLDPPIMIGGKKPKMLHLIARQADWWNVNWVGLEECRRLVQQMDQVCAEVGRDPTTLRRTWLGWAACASTAEEAQAIGGDYRGIFGSPSEVISQLEEFIALGFDYFMLASPQFPDITSIQLLKREVIPVLQLRHPQSSTPSSTG